MSCELLFLDVKQRNAFFFLPWYSDFVFLGIPLS